MLFLLCIYLLVILFTCLPISHSFPCLSISHFSHFFPILFILPTFCATFSTRSSHASFILFSSPLFLSLPCLFLSLLRFIIIVLLPLSSVLPFHSKWSSRSSFQYPSFMSLFLSFLPSHNNFSPSFLTSFTL